MIIREVNVRSRSPNRAIGQNGVREHRQKLPGSTVELASYKDRNPLIRDCNRGGSVDRSMNGSHKQHTGNDDDSEENKGKGYRNGEYHQQEYVRQSWIGAYNSNAVLADTCASSEELFSRFTSFKSGPLGHSHWSALTFGR
jgi:hypothetical protein